MTKIYRATLDGFFQDCETLDEVRSWAIAKLAAHSDLKGRTLRIFPGMRHPQGTCVFQGAPKEIVT